MKNTTVCVGDLKQRYNITTGQLLTRAELDAMAEDEDFSWNYNSYYRLRVDKSPSLICELNGQTSTVHQIYSLTADEVLFAGGSFDINQNYYLIENAKKLGNMANGWWTITPMSAGPGDGWDFAEYVEAQGNIATNHIGDSEANIRPALSLIPGVELANDSGDGTIDNPYVIR